jgi:hypothetical protein
VRRRSAAHVLRMSAGMILTGYPLTAIAID